MAVSAEGSQVAGPPGVSVRPDTRKVEAPMVAVGVAQLRPVGMPVFQSIRFT